MRIVVGMSPRNNLFEAPFIEFPVPRFERGFVSIYIVLYVSSSPGWDARMASPVLIIGAGDHARVVLATLRALGAEVLGWSAESIRKESPGDPPLIAPHEIEGMDRGSLRLVNGIGSIGKVTQRADVFLRYKAVGFRFRSVVHPAAYLSSQASCGEGTQVMAGAVVQCGSQLGENVLVNTGAVVDHDCIIGRHCHIASGAVLSGAVSVGDAAHIGAGAVARQYVRIGTAAVIGAGAVVIADVPSDRTFVGVPARDIATSRSASPLS